MNEFFSFPRFSRLFIKHTTEHLRTYLMSIGVLAGILVLGGALLFIIAPETLDSGFQIAAYAILMLVAGGIFASTVFEDYGQKTRAIPALILPATAFEKFLVAWLYSFPIFLVVYTTVYCLVLFGFGGLWHWTSGEHHRLFNLAAPELRIFGVLFSEVHSIAFFGAISFRKLQFIKTGFSLFISFVVVMLCNTLFLKIITGAKVEKLAMPFGFLNFYIGDKDYTIGIGHDSSVLILALIQAVAVLGWVAAYFRLKEKQV